MLCSNEIELAMSSFKSTFPSVMHLNSTILDAANTMLSNTTSDNPLYQNDNIGNGCWKIVMCVNAQTKEIHFENDVTYTTITSPKQKALKSKYSFIFQVNENTKVMILINSGVNIVFSGKFMAHHQ